MKDLALKIFAVGWTAFILWIAILAFDPKPMSESDLLLMGGVLNAAG